eukprot:scaffold29987_cov47-Phaeocystis_antarctica.AAC.1
MTASLRPSGSHATRSAGWHLEPHRPSWPTIKRLTGDAQVTRHVSQYGIKVSSWGSETFKIVILVENHHQKPKNWLDDYHPLWGGWVLISENIYVLTIYVHIGVVNSGRHHSPHIRKSSLDHDSGGKKRGCHSYFQIYFTFVVFTSVTHVSPSRTASLAIIVRTRSPFVEISISQKFGHAT